MSNTERNIRRRDDRAYRRYLAATKASASLKRRIHALAAIIPRGTTDTDDHIKTLLKGCEDDIAAEEAANDALLSRIPAANRKTPHASELATEVFAMPEILEHILTYLPQPDVLNAYSINKTFHHTIEGSVKLQRMLGLLPDPQSYFFQPAYSLMATTYGIHASDPKHMMSFEEEGLAEDGVKVRIQTMLTLDRNFALPRLGVRCSQMQVSQPPIKEMKVLNSCCEPSPFSFLAQAPVLSPTVIKSATGITIGQALEAMARAEEAHALCPGASEHEHDEEGFARSNIAIEGIVSLKDDDPALRHKKGILRRFAKQVQKQNQKRARLRPYVAAKQAARDNGNPIPTLEEFEAAQEAAHGTGQL